MYLYILYMLQNMHYMLCTLSVGLEVEHDLNIDDRNLSAQEDIPHGSSSFFICAQSDFNLNA